ncbi:MAG: thioredoxin domain-containing protein [Pseudobdellovibrionaceae bacterium]
MQTLTTEEFKQKVFDFTASKDWAFKGPRPAIVDFYADWCGPCRALAPILETVASKYSNEVDVYKVDTEATPELAALFGVRGIPSILFIPQTGEPAMATGLMGEDGFDNAIKEIFGISK